MQKTGYKIFTLLIIFGMISSCYYDKEDQLYPNSVCHFTSVSFASEINQIIQSNCASAAGCHGTNPGSVSLLTYQDIKSSLDNGRIQDYVFTKKSMPKNGSISACSSKKLLFWINQGYLNN